MDESSKLKLIYQHYLVSGKICTDSRYIVKGCVFFALRGDRFDGNQFTTQSLQMGATLAVTDDPGKADIPGHIYVSNCLDTLQELAKLHRSNFNFPFIGITGSNGKTTTKELILSVLSKKFNAFATKGNLNNHIGVPLTILSIPSDCNLAIIEMGANHIGEIAQLASIANPDIGIITSIGKAHLEGFGSVEGIAKAKFELFEHVIAKSGTIIFREHDLLIEAKINRYQDIIKLKTDSFEISDQLFKYKIRQSIPDIIIEIETQGGQERSITSSLPGEYNALNILLAVITGLKFGVEMSDISDAIAAYIPSNNRSQWIVFKNNKILLDAYNANPTSMVAAINTFAEIDHPNKILVLGAMKELGTDTQEEHRMILELIARFDWKAVYLFGDEMTSADIESKYLHFKDIEQLRTVITSNIDNDLLLVKGSRSNALESLFSTNDMIKP